MSNSPDHFYINANIRNNENSFLPASYNEVRKKPILEGNVDDYTLSVVRFTISTNTIPLWVPHIDLNLSTNPTKDPDQTVYRISVVNSSTNVPIISVPLIWTPQLSTEMKPAFTTPQTFSRYYYMYTIQHFVNLFNNALQGINPQTLQSVPTLTFEDGLFSMYGDKRYHEGSTDQLYRLVLNEPLSELLNGFPVERVAENDPNQFNAIIFKSLHTNVLVQDTTTNTQYNPIPYIEGELPGALQYRLKMSQDRGSLAQFQIFRGVQFTSSSLPVRSEGVSATTPYGLSTNQNISSSDGVQSVLIDMDCVLDDKEMINQSVLQYQPNIYHEIDLIQGQNIETLQFNIYWFDSYGNSHPLYLKHGSASIKFAFRKKKYLN